MQSHHKPKTLRRFKKLPHLVIVRAPGLLPMLYTLAELGEELNLHESTLRDWLSTGAPHTRDARQHIWINGTDFAAWVRQQRKPKAERKLTDDEAYCLRCKTVVTLLHPKTQRIKGKLIHIRGQCPRCKNTIIRGGRYGHPRKLSESQSASELSQGRASNRL